MVKRGLENIATTSDTDMMMFLYVSVDVSDVYRYM